jgi:Tol biopolymer transport system component
LTQVTSSGDDDWSTFLSFDGSRVAWNRTGDGIYVASTDGTGIALVPTSAPGDIMPTMNKNGDKLAWVSSRNGIDEVFTANADGSELVNVSAITGLAGSRASIGPDGERVAWANGGTIYVAGVDGSALTAISVGSGSSNFSASFHGKYGR